MHARSAVLDVPTVDLRPPAIDVYPVIGDPVTIVFGAAVPGAVVVASALVPAGWPAPAVSYADGEVTFAWTGVQTATVAPRAAGAVTILYAVDGAPARSLVVLRVEWSARGASRGVFYDRTLYPLTVPATTHTVALGPIYLGGPQGPAGVDAPADAVIGVGITHAVKLTAAEYAALAVPDPATMYVVTA
jgi:hypothetical protein